MKHSIKASALVPSTEDEHPLDTFFDAAADFDSNDAELSAIKQALQTCYDLLNDEDRATFQANLPQIITDNCNVRY